MIENKKELMAYMEADRARYKDNPPIFKDRIFKNEKWYIWQYIRALRHVEYYINTGNKKSLFYLYWWYRYKHLSFLTHITVYPNTCDKGLYIPHIGDMIWVKSSAQIGKNCTLRPGVVIGKKGNENATDTPVVVGDNVNFGLGVKVLGKLNIGNHVSIGANSVVTKDIPNNAVAVGLPARVIKIIE